MISKLLRWLTAKPKEQPLPQAGAKMTSGGGPVITVTEANECYVRYQMPDGKQFTRSRKGFMKNYKQKKDDDIL